MVRVTTGKPNDPLGSSVSRLTVGQTFCDDLTLSGHLRRLAMSKVTARPAVALACLVFVFARVPAVLAGGADHPCQDEVDTACPDRPGSEIARCLKDKKEHERPIELSSECTDFVALNIACAEELENHCDSIFFSRDTVLCLQEWTDATNLGEKCAGVMQWAIPAKEEVVTDELGLSAEDYAEKEAWRAKRKNVRTAAIERMQEESPELKEKERLKMEKIKQENPEEYEWLMKEKKAAEIRFQEAKKHERLIQAAKERQRRKDAGLPEVDPEEEKTKAAPQKVKVVKRQKKQPEGVNWLPYVLGALAVMFVFFNVLNFMQRKKNKDDDSDDDKED